MRHDDPDIRVVRAVAARIFLNQRGLTVERVLSGGSTHVYRLTGDATTWYLRVLPERDASFAPEVLAHRLLRERGVRVPDVPFWEHYEAELGKSVMATTEIQGASILDRAPDVTLREIVVDAGRDLARANSIPVRGFGWIKRNRADLNELEAEYESQRSWVDAEWVDSMAVLARGPLTGDEVATLHLLRTRYDHWLDDQDARLAHGDFDVTHIFEQDGRYSGIIDWGEIRGTSRWYDLGHFRMHDGAQLDAMVLPWLLDGYAQVVELPDDAWPRICFASLLIGVRRSARSWVRHGHDYAGGQGLLSIRRDIAALLQQAATNF